MKFVELSLKGTFIIEMEPQHDERGYFERTFCKKEFIAHGLKADICQSNISLNLYKGTVRGMHYQAPPHMEAKLVSCMSGTLNDIIIDIRPSSSTFKSWESIELSEHNHLSLYIPEGFAHGFQTKEDKTVIHYQMFNYYHPESARGIRWNDHTLGINWELPVSNISPRDQSYPDFNVQELINGFNHTSA